MDKCGVVGYLLYSGPRLKLLDILLKKIHFGTFRTKKVPVYAGGREMYIVLTCFCITFNLFIKPALK